MARQLYSAVVVDTFVNRENLCSERVSWCHYGSFDPGRPRRCLGSFHSDAAMDHEAIS